MTPLFHSLGPLAVIAWLTQHLEVIGPVGAPARQRCLVVYCGVGNQETNATPARKALLVQKFVDVFDSMMAFGLEFKGFSPVHVDRTDSGVSVVPCFTGTFGSFRVATIPIIPCVSTTFLTSSGRRVAGGIMVFGARLLRPIKRLSEVLSGFAWADHRRIKPLTEGLVK